MDKKILPCPFCGAPQPHALRDFSSVGRMDHYYLYCNGCGVCGPTGHTEDQAIKAWNMRPRQPRESGYD
jgi:Lar family restriction alleviation protein